MRLLLLLSASALAFTSTRPLVSYASTSAQDCTLASILLIAVPNLHASDLIHLTRSNEAYNSAKEQGSTTSKHLYLGQKSRIAEDLKVTEFINHCGASLVSPGEEQREDGKTVTVQVVNGLESDELDRGQDSARRAVLKNLDDIISTRTATLQSPYLIVITSPPLHSTHTSNLHFQSKRQLYSDEDFEEYEDQISQADLVEKYSAYLMNEKAAESTKNGTNIFAPKPKSGLLHRYVFFTPTLIFALSLTFFLFVPLVLLSTSYGIATINTVQGLEGKMLGTVGPERS